MGLQWSNDSDFLRSIAVLFTIFFFFSPPYPTDFLICSTPCLLVACAITHRLHPNISYSVLLYTCVPLLLTDWNLNAGLGRTMP